MNIFFNFKKKSVKNSKFAKNLFADKFKVPKNLSHQNRNKQTNKKTRATKNVTMNYSKICFLGKKFIVARSLFNEFLMVELSNQSKINKKALAKNSF